MAEHEPDPKSIKQDLQEFDQAIEDDIRRLKRSSNLLILLGAMAVILLIAIAGFRLYLYVQEAGPSNRTHFKSVQFVKNDDTLVYAEPDTNSKVIVRLEQGESVLLIDEKDDWGKIEKSTISGWVQKVHLSDKKMWDQRDFGGVVPVRVYDVDLFVDELENFAIIGKIQNISEGPLKNIKIQVNFYDRTELYCAEEDKEKVCNEKSAGKCCTAAGIRLCCDEKGNDHPPVETTETWIGREKPLGAGVERKFIITGKYQKNFKKFRYYIVSFE